MYFNNNVPEDVRDTFKSIYRSVPVVNQGVTVSRRVTPEQRELIASALIGDESGDQSLLQKYAQNAQTMVPVGQHEYDEHYKILTDVVFGWEIMELDPLTGQAKARQAKTQIGQALN